MTRSKCDPEEFSERISVLTAGRGSDRAIGGSREYCSVELETVEIAADIVFLLLILIKLEAVLPGAVAGAGAGFVAGAGERQNGELGGVRG